MNYFSNNIRFLRIRNGLKQSDMLDKVGITRTTWSSYENEISQPDIDGILKIARFFNVNVTDLLETNLKKKEGPVPQTVWAQKKMKYSRMNEPENEGSNNLVLEITQTREQIMETQKQIILALHTLLDRLQVDGRSTP